MLTATACDGAGPGPAASSTHNIFGTDDREAITSSAYPWTAIGRLDTGCTATLIADDLVLTAAHCVIDESTGRQMDNIGSFRPNLVAGDSRDSARITEVIVDAYASSQLRTDDWAVLRLEKPLGRDYGFMDLKSVGSGGYSSMRISLAGYSGDFRSGQTAGVHRGCSVRRDGGSLLYHDCDMTRGASGGPVFVFENGRGVIVGVNVSEYRWGETSLTVDEYEESYSNHAVPSRTFYSRVEAIKRGSSQPPPRPQPDPIVNGDTIDGYLSLALVYTDGDIGAREGYESCYRQVRAFVEITERSYMFPYSINVRGTREAMVRMVDALSCTRVVYEIVEIGNDFDLIPLRRRD